MGWCVRVFDVGFSFVALVSKRGERESKGWEINLGGDLVLREEEGLSA